MIDKNVKLKYLGGKIFPANYGMVNTKINRIIMPRQKVKLAV